MIKRTRAEISKCIIHKVANKYNSGQNALSENLVRFDEESYELLMPFLLKNFGTVTQSYRFNHHADVRLNEINKYTSDIFEDENMFIEHSKNIVNHLYEQSNSANIKTGDVIGLDNVIVATSPEFDEHLSSLKNFKFEEPPTVKVIESTQVVTTEKVESVFN